MKSATNIRYHHFNDIIEPLQANLKNLLKSSKDKKESKLPTSHRLADRSKINNDTELPVCVSQS